MRSLLSSLILFASAHAYTIGPASRIIGPASHIQPSVSHVMATRPANMARCAPIQLAAPKSTAPNLPSALPAAAYASLAGVTAVTFKILSAKTALASTGLTAAILAWTVGLPTLLNAQQLMSLGGPGVAESMGGNVADASLTKLARDAAIAVGVEPPKYVYEIPKREPNAFAASGFGSAETTVAVTSGLRKLLSKSELSAVLAHEMGHLKNRDVARNMHLVIAIAGLSGIYEAGRILLDTTSRSSSSSSDSDSDSDSGGGVMLGLGLMALGLGSQGVAHLVQLSASRGAELEADFVAAEAFGADSLINALTKIDEAAGRAPADLRDDKEGRKMAFAMISDGPSSPQIEKKAGKKKQGGWWSSATSKVGKALRTHPPTEERIAALESAVEKGDVPRGDASWW